MKLLFKTMLFIFISGIILLLSFLFLPFLILFLVLPVFLFGFRAKPLRRRPQPPENSASASNSYANNDMNESDTVYDVEFEVLEDKKIIPENNADEGKK